MKYADTTIVSGGRKVMLGEYAQVKAIRAWTYLQLGLNYGKATWLTEPILDIDDMNRQYEEVTLGNLLLRLIEDIAALANVRTEDYPSYGTINGLPATYSLINPGVLYADLCMYYGAFTGDPSAYRIAAYQYYGMLTLNRRYEASVYYNMYSDSEFKYLANLRWNAIYDNFPVEAISLIRYNNNFSESPKISPLTKLCLPTNTSDTYMIKPSKAAIDLWKNEIYTFYRINQKDVVYTKGDLRGQARMSISMPPLGSYDYDYINMNAEDSIPYITKYGYYLQFGNSASANLVFNVSLCRLGQLYLRYAEALNALGKPSLAFAVLKYGMKAEVLNDSTKVSPDEIDPLPYYCDFMDSRFSNYLDNNGFHSRGCGATQHDTIYYAFTPEALLENRAYYGIPEKLETKMDSMAFVNVLICKESGMETAFEGNRFHDLMRLSLQHERLTGRPDFLAKWVGRRNPALEGKLANPDNWYLSYK